MRRPVAFSSGDERCRGWLYEPQVHPPGAGCPCIVMAHGFGAVLEARLDDYAQRFASAGYVVLAFDYRNFGESEGGVRHIVDIEMQLEDWEAAIAFVRDLRQVDPKRVGLWGTSFSGGHVVAIGARDPGLAAIVAQCPMMDGRAAALQSLRRSGTWSALVQTALAVCDFVCGALGQAALTVPIVGPPGSSAAMTTLAAEHWYRRSMPKPFDNAVGARVFLGLPRYRPLLAASRVRAPLLVQVCSTDDVTPPDAAAEVARRAPRGELRRYPIGHFDIYEGVHFERAITDQLLFFERHLSPPQG